VQAARARTAVARQRRGAPDMEIEAAWQLLDPTALTIGFARRFATYKRATLIFHDPDRLARLLEDPRRPVQLVFAGKAHPKDEPGKELMRRIGEFAALPEFRSRVVLLPNYDMRLSRLLVSGSDVWLNNPIRPNEASGTSGMKAAMNGVLNLSVLDGWWDEAPREGAGFTLGDDMDGRTDDDIASALYDRLESEVVPLFYDRPGGDRAQMPAAWVERMATAASTLGRLFSSDRMLGDYLVTSYAPAADRVRRLSEDDERGARELAAWKAKVRGAWDAVDFASVTLDPADPARVAPGQSFRVEIQLQLGEFGPEDLFVDWFEGEMDRGGGVDAGFSTPLAFVERRDGTATWAGTVVRPEDDRRGYSVRVRPWHALLSHLNETGLVLWAE